MKRFLIWGIKWTCLSLCGFALCGNMAYVAVSLDDTIQVKYNSEKERWEGKGNILLEYDSALGKYVFTNDKIRVCLEEITSESAALYDSSHQQYSYQDPMLEGAFVSEVGMNNGLTVYIYNLYNTKYYSETYSCVLESSGNTVNYRAAFQYILEDAYKHYGESCKYTLFDLDKEDAIMSRKKRLFVLLISVILCFAMAVPVSAGTTYNQRKKASQKLFNAIYYGKYSKSYKLGSDCYMYDMDINKDGYPEHVVTNLDEDMCIIYTIYKSKIRRYEVLIVHVPSDEDSHRRKSIERNLGDIVNKICERDCSSLNIPWKVNASLVVVNEHVSDLDSAINIITDKHTFTPELIDMLRGNAVDAFLYELVTYVEAHMAEVRAVIKKWSTNLEGNMSLVLLKVIWEILSEFAKDKGIDLAAGLGITGSLNWEAMWRSLADRQEIGERIIKAVRSSMSKIFIRERRYGCGYVKDGCYYDQEYLWIPTKVFKEIMKTNRIPSNKYRETLVKWKQQELLLPDESGLTYKLRVNEVPIQTYRFKKALFDQAFSVPIEGLGRDEEDENEKNMCIVWKPQNGANYKK